MQMQWIGMMAPAGGGGRRPAIDGYFKKISQKASLLAPAPQYTMHTAYRTWCTSV